MSLTGGIVLFAVIWFMVFFVVLPQRLKTQGDVQQIVPGTPASAPSELRLKRKVVITSAIAVVLWSIIATIILSGMISIHDLDWFNRVKD
ncbi:hypothetical protein BFP70_03590 [Thioclava sp. SK-1]|uniref:DUF1467 family protein n=1 Tax=Thioclava sp. SK-1 TaxID=1889770 RepID=UPI0008252D0B|nr:DUF1467 family protein [Thioclava sp. SK-1]OCX66921.1 hypothetical protein BFP70_03590 [Thioclava sp. SK-1]